MSVSDELSMAHFFRHKDAKCWTCSKRKKVAVATSFCEGPKPPASLREQCDAGMCEACTSEIAGKKLCPNCRPKVQSVTAVQSSLF
jgi:hypothetical protein